MSSKLLASVLALVALSAFGQQKPVYSDAEAAKHVGEEATVTGKVVNVSTSGKGTTFLNFGGRYPNETFGGVIFASKTEAVGDVKQYEGKDVSITGRIEMSPSQKPQIVINTADQIKLAGAASPFPPTIAPPPAAPATTTPTPTPAPPSTASTPSTAPAPPAGKRIGKIELANGWNSPRRDGELARKDLARLLGTSAWAGDATEVDTSIEVYPGIPLLTPLATAKKTLKLEGVPQTKSKVTTPGLPQNSFSAYEMGGIFPGGFDRLILVTDGDDQVVSVLLVDTSSRARANNEADVNGYHTYNFIAGTGKGAGYLVVKHDVTKPPTPGGTVVVDTMLVDPTDGQALSSARKSKSGTSSTTSSSSSKQKTGKVLERSRWFVPAPLVSLILRCVSG